jgi:hypothetical protein
MGLWTMIAVIVVVATIGETIKVYLKTKEKSGAFDTQVKEKLLRYEQEMEALRKRVRNLEAIAAGAPDEFSMKDVNETDHFDFDSTDEFNEKLVNQLARKKTKG